MAEITNKAILNYNSGSTPLSAESNTARVTLQGPLVISKRSLEPDYHLNDDLTYNIFVSNTSTTPVAGLTITDDLGTYEFTEGVNVTPLTYLNNAHQYVDNAFIGEIAGTVAADNHSVTFSIGALEGLSTLMLQFRVKTNEYAPAVVGGSNIISTATATATGIASPVTIAHTLPVASYADVTIDKTMRPDPIVDGGTLSYIFNIKNTGTIPATNVILEDIFVPAPDITAVRINNQVTTEYDYTSGTFTLPAAGSSFDFEIPAATFTPDSVSGVISLVPGTASVVVQGTI